MHSSLSDAIDAMDACGRGFHFTRADTPTQYLDFGQLRERTRALARTLAAVAGRRGAPVLLIVSGQAAFVPLFLGVVRAGLVAVPVAPPSLTEGLVEYAARVERIRRVSGASLVVVDDPLQPRLGPLLPGGRVVPISDLATVTARADLPRLHGGDLALVQFTSGSTGDPKGVALSHANLVANASAIGHALALDPARDCGVSWLPMHHDMGLIGFVVTPVLLQVTNWYLPPLEFARRPHRWLDLVSRTRATVSYAPNFGYDLVARRVRPGDIGGWDLSAWRVAGCGGEAVIPGVLERFASLLSPAGFDPAAFVPSYGLAEATLAVAMSPLGRGVASRRLGVGSVATHGVSSGPAVDGTEVRVVSAGKTSLPDGHEGDIQVRGAGVARHVWTDRGVVDACDAEGWLDTGDVGLLYGGELHVSGRRKEVVAVNGRQVFPHDVENCLQALEGFRPGIAVAFGRPGAGSEQVVLVVEGRPADDATTLRRRIRTRVRERLGLAVADVVLVSRGTIPRTSSGKLRRTVVRARYLADALAGDHG